MSEIEPCAKTNYFLKIVICEIICICLVLSCIFISKLFFKKEYNAFCDLYKKYAVVNTDVEEVMKN